MPALCTSTLLGGPCDREAVAAVHIHGMHADGRPTVLIRPDHIDPTVEAFVDDWRCAECMHHEIDAALLLVAGPE